MSRVRRHWLVALLLAGLALAGCSGTQETRATATQYPEAAKSAAQILADARQAAREVRTFQVTEAIRRQRQSFGADMHFAGTSAAYGSIKYGSVSCHVVRIGNVVYVKAPAAFYLNVGSPARQARLMAGRWIKTSAGSAGFHRFADFPSGAQFFGQILGSAASAGMVKVPGVQMIDGTPAVGLADPRDGSRLYIALHGSALPVRIDGPGRSGSISFVGYGQPVTVVAPRQALDVSNANA